MGSYRSTPSDRDQRDRLSVSSRRTALGVSLGGIVSGLGLRQTEARKQRKKHKKCKKDKPSICAGQNWCVDRSQTCGPQGGFSKWLVEATGGNICAEILFQAATCADCEPPSCTECRCVLAAGGGDRCNNGVNGLDFICARQV